MFDGQKVKRHDEAAYLSYTHKQCSKCGDIKSVDLFHSKTTRTARVGLE